MSDQDNKIPRRDALKWLASAAAAAPVIATGKATAAEPTAAPRTSTDPDLVKPVVPWNRILTEAELKTLTAICDVIIPEDEKSPSASAVGVPDFINEWVSAPYPTQMTDRQTIRGGLSWLNTESSQRFEQEFADLKSEQKTSICDDIAYLPKAKPEHRFGALFFAKLRDLTATGFYTTSQGMKDIGYVGNMPLTKFDGPPPHVLKHIGLA